MSRLLKISLDYHGVIDQDFAYWRDFCELAKSRSHKIYIISGGPQVLIRQKLADNSIPYDILWCVLDYCLALSAVEVNEKGSFSITEGMWNSTKGYLCAQNHIDLHIDDNVAYQPYFQTPFCLYDKISHNCSLFSNQLMFVTPIDLLSQIENCFMT